MVYLLHKITEGYVDLTFNKASTEIGKLEKVAEWLRKHDVLDVNAVITGKAGSLRIKDPKLDMLRSFEEADEYDIDACFKTIAELVDVANVIGTASDIADLKWFDYNKGILSI